MNQIDSMKDFGTIIRINRQKLHLTQAQLAGVAGVGERLIIDIEKGKPTCEFEKVLRVASMVGLTFFTDSSI